MAARTLLFGWELGEGMGHLLPHQPWLQALAGQGHHIHVAAKELWRVPQAFGDSDWTLWQAPQGSRRPPRAYRPTYTFAQILYNVGFSGIDDVAARLGAWTSILQAARPDMVVADHSPTLLLAARMLLIPRVVIGTGFCIPPAQRPLPLFLNFKDVKNLDEIARAEVAVTACINAALRRHGAAPIESLGSLYGEAAATLLCTYPETDHVPRRQEGEYLGLPPATKHSPPEWPPGPGPKVFGYLKPFPALESVLETLNQGRFPTLIVSDGIPGKTCGRFASETLRFSTRPVDLSLAAREARLGITNATHFTSLRLLACGVPLLMFPLNLEQEITARRITELGAGLWRRPQDPAAGPAALAELLSQERYRTEAAAFAARNRQIDTQSPVSRIVEIVQRAAPE